MEGIKDTLLKILSVFLYIFSLTNALFGQVKTFEDTSTHHQTAFSLFLIGDAGAPLVNGKDPVLSLLQYQLQEAGENSAVIFLGDNIYPEGLPPEGSEGRSKAEERIKAQLDILKGYKGKAFVIPGNHDWQRGKTRGWEYIKEEEKLVEGYLSNVSFLPDNGCPGPVEVKLNDEITLIIIDSQWWLHPWDKPEEESDCDVKDAASVIVALEDILQRNSDKRIVVTAHHPIYTRGNHGGFFSLKEQVFPFTDLNKNLYIPLPVIGSIYPLYRKYIGDVQDIAHPKNRLLRKSLVKAFKDYPGLIYASGHDHSLEFTAKDSINYIVSGAGSKRTYVKKSTEDFFAASETGFAKVDFLLSGAARLNFWNADAENPLGKLIFSKDLISTFKNKKAETSHSVVHFPDSIAVAASDKYQAGKLKQMILGKNYRKEWETQVMVPVLDLAKERGGLKILQRGGGMQTKSLRLEDAQRKEYVLRSVEKYPENAIPEILRGSFAQDLVQDQISASHPYAALVIPDLAAAADIPHANPKLVYIPDDPALGKYRKLFANTLALFEERSYALNTIDEEEKSYSTSKLLEKLQEDNDNKVDQKAVLRARLFDLIIGDWDRHDDQWRWVVKTEDKKKIFSPLPRDRDQAFFVNEGALPKMASRKWALPKIQGFGEKIRYVEGFMYNGRYFDRTFLTGLSEKDWEEAAEDLQKRLTDEVISRSLINWNRSIYQLSGREIVNKLSKRRDDLKSYAKKYYKFLARAVDVAGTDKKELFKVQREKNGDVNITVIKLNKKNDPEDTLFSRSFNYDETKEIRLYGVGGADRFEVDGDAPKGIKVRIIGGEGKDYINDNSHVKGFEKKTVVYDTEEGNEFILNAESKDLRSSDPSANSYNRKDFKYDVLSPLLSLEYNVDDGVFLGGGFLYKKHGFRKEPFAEKHKITADYAINTSSYNFGYLGQFTDVIRKWDFILDADLKAPNYVNNFFGLGNESIYEKGEHRIRYYRVRFQKGSLGAYLENNIGEKQTFLIGPQYIRIEVENNANRFINNFDKNGLNRDDIFKIRSYAGFRLAYNADTRDNTVIPTQGTKFNVEFNYLKRLEDTSFNMYQLNADVTFYWSFKLPAKLTLATRFGGGTHLGNFEFFQANYLGGPINLRGYRKTRFAGRSSIYNNTELRLKLFSFRSYLFPAVVGILGFNDIGRVWVNSEESAKWHDGYGGGIWFAPFKQAVVCLMYAQSEEKGLPLIKFGFMF